LVRIEKTDGWGEVWLSGFWIGLPFHRYRRADAVELYGGRAAASLAVLVNIEKAYGWT
jgi:hypothetical protein